MGHDLQDLVAPDSAASIPASRIPPSQGKPASRPYVQRKLQERPWDLQASADASSQGTGLVLLKNRLSTSTSNNCGPSHHRVAWESVKGELPGQVHPEFLTKEAETRIVFWATKFWLVCHIELPKQNTMERLGRTLQDAGFIWKNPSIPVYRREWSRIRLGQVDKVQKISIKLIIIYNHSSVSTGIGLRGPAETRFLSCPSPLNKVTCYLHITYEDSLHNLIHL